MNANPVIEIDHLTKYFGTREIVRDLKVKTPTSGQLMVSTLQKASPSNKQGTK